MAEYLSEFVTNLAMPPAVRPVPHQFAMGDNNAYTFTALLCDARNPDAELMAGTVSGTLLRPDGTTVALGGSKGAEVRRVNLDGGGMCNATPCSVTLPQACFAYPGRVTLVITLVDGTTITQALAVSAVVARTSTDAVVDPGELVPDVAELQAIATELTAAVGGAIRFDEAQTLTDAQKAQARANIGAGEGGGGTVTGAVRYDTAQTLTDAEKAQAQDNIGAAAVSAITSLSADITALETQKAVRYDAQQFLTDAQKTQARTNVGAAGADETTAAIQTEAVARDQAIADKAVRYDTAQTLTDTQKAQARGNIVAGSGLDVEMLMAGTGCVNYGYDTGWSIDAASGYPYTATRNGIRITVNSTEAMDATRYLKITGESERESTTAGVRGWTGGISLVSGHVYIVRYRLVGGSVTITDSAPYLSVYEVGSSSTLGIARSAATIKDYFWRVFQAGSTAVNLSFNFSAGNVFSNAVYEITLEDVTTGGFSIPVSDAAPVIAAIPGAAYNCTAAYVTSLSFTPSGSGICSVRFVSGTTPTVLTLPNTVKMPDWWNGTEANRTYTITITDGVYADVEVWSASAVAVPQFVEKVLSPVTLSVANGGITTVTNDYGYLGSTDARLYVYPFGLAILSAYFKITTTPGSTERTFATLGVQPIRQVGMTITSQSGTYCAFFIDTSGNLKFNTASSDATGTYHVCVAFPIHPYIPS